LCGCIFICNTAKNNLGLRSAINLIYSKLLKQKEEPAGAIGAKAAWKQRSEVDQAGARILVNCLLPTAYWLKRGL
jgi:hypothetical protein